MRTILRTNIIDNNYPNKIFIIHSKNNSIQVDYYNYTVDENLMISFVYRYYYNTSGDFNITFIASEINKNREKIQLFKSYFIEKGK